VAVAFIGCNCSTLRYADCASASFPSKWYSIAMQHNSVAASIESLVLLAVAMFALAAEGGDASPPSSSVSVPLASARLALGSLATVLSVWLGEASAPPLTGTEAPVAVEAAAAAAAAAATAAAVASVAGVDGGCDCARDSDRCEWESRKAYSKSPMLAGMASTEAPMADGCASRETDDNLSFNRSRRSRERLDECCSTLAVLPLAPRVGAGRASVVDCDGSREMGAEVSEKPVGEGDTSRNTVSAVDGDVGLELVGVVAEELCSDDSSPEDGDATCGVVLLLLLLRL